MEKIDMGRPTILLAASALLMSTLACTITPQLPDININIPTIEVGEAREERHSIPLAGAESADVDLRFGAGRLELEAGVSDDLFSGYFRYNVERWAPEISREEDKLTIRQGGDEGKWGIPSGNIRNEWELEFSPEVPLDLDVRVGAGDGELDFTSLKVTDLDVDIGGGDLILRFEEPNAVAMDHLTLDAGASKIEVHGVGNANPETMRLQGGVGDILLDLTGAWSHSAEVKVRAGAGALTFRLPDDIGVEVEARGGLAKVDAYGLKQMGSTYTNDVFGNTDTELHIDVTAGVGNVRLIVEGAGG
ncbi:MAG: toast rack family protein [Anaerolineae bacterium]|jgi:hypothetical protein